MTRRARRGRTYVGARSGHAEPQITISEEAGIRYLHFGNEWVQGALNLKQPWNLALDYSRHMMAWLLFAGEPERLLQLGLGTGSLTHFAHYFFKNTEVTVVDNSEAVVRAARSQFKLPPDDDRLNVHIDDGHDFIGQPHRRGQFNILQVDVFDAEVRGPVLNSQSFYNACRAVLARNGIMVVNLFGEVASYQDNLQRIINAFDDQVLVLPPVEAGNVIALAFADPFVLQWPELYARALQIEQLYQLPVTGMVNALKNSVSSGLSGPNHIA
ncbi:MAG: spermidine synthase [Burkholderiaceae bacterium]